MQKLKICLVHNAYRLYSGEEAVVEAQEEVFRRHGCEVVKFCRSSSEMAGKAGEALCFFAGLYNPLSRRRFGELLDREKPSVVHIHNLYPLINPCILPEAKKRGIPVVMTMHNFRLYCPNGLFMGGAEICEACAKANSVWPCVTKRCLGGRAKSLNYAWRTWIAQRAGWYHRCVDRYLCLTDFQRNKLVEYGLNAEKTRLVPNFVSDEWMKKASCCQAERPGKYIAYMGRLSGEKGLNLLLDAARQLPDIPFKLAGNTTDLKKLVQEVPANVEFVGYLTGSAQENFLRQARVHVMASRCYENFPMSLLQGMAMGLPEAVPSHGGMGEIIRGAGEVFDLTTESLAGVLGRLWHDDLLRERYRQGALSRAKEFTAEAFWEKYAGILQEFDSLKGLFE